MESLISLTLIMLSISLVCCVQNSTNATTPTTTTNSFQANSTTNKPTVFISSSPSSSKQVPSTDSQTKICGAKVCSMYEICNSTSYQCYCPSSASVVVDKRVCGSDGHTYKNFEELKMTACNRKSNVTKVENDHCKHRDGKKSYSNKKKTITIIVIISLLLILVLVVAVVLFLKKRREGATAEVKKDKSDAALL